MFNLFTVTMPFTLSSLIKLLITLYTSEDCNLFHQGLQELATWNNRWHLVLNTLKCFHLHHHFSNTKYSTANFCVNGETVVTDNNIKDLRNMFSTDSHWDSHYSKITFKAYS